MVMGQPRVKSGGLNRAKPDSRAKSEKERGRGLCRGPGEPLPNICWNFELKINHSGVVYSLLCVLLSSGF